MIEKGLLLVLRHVIKQIEHHENKILNMLLFGPINKSSEMVQPLIKSANQSFPLLAVQMNAVRTIHDRIYDPTRNI